MEKKTQDRILRSICFGIKTHFQCDEIGNYEVCTYESIGFEVLPPACWAVGSRHRVGAKQHVISRWVKVQGC